jgi:hypothetical protein
MRQKTSPLSHGASGDVLLGMRHITSRAVAIAALSALLLACHSGAPSTPPAPLPQPAAPARAAYASGEEVLAAMHDRYAGKWYSTITFTQKTSRLGTGDKWNVSTWYEALAIPARLRIDFDSAPSGSGVLYARDSAWSFQNGRALAPQAAVNPLLVLGFDVYGQPASRTAAVLRKEGFDLSRVHRATLDDRPMLVVGAREGERHRKQFWIDAEHLYFVRMLQPVGQDTSRTQDIRFVNYRREGGGWIAPRVEIHSGGKLTFFEEYSDIRTNVVLDESLFDPTKWKTAKHWKTQ